MERADPGELRRRDIAALSPRTPSHVKKELRSWEARVLDGEITPQEKQDLRHLFRQFVA